MSQAYGRYWPFPELEISRVCKNVSGAAIADKALVRLVLGRNHGGVGDTTAAYTAASLDGVAVGDSWPNFIVAATNDDYPTTGGSASYLPVLGIQASGGSLADDASGRVVFRGLVTATLTLTAATDDHVPGACVFYNKSADVLGVRAAAADIDVEDIIVGRTLEYITNTTAATVDCPIYFDGFSTSYAIINGA